MPESRTGIDRTGRHRIHCERNGNAEHSRRLEHLPYHAVVNVDEHGVLSTEHRRRLHGTARKISLQHGEIFRFVIVEFQNLVTCTEAHLICKVIDINAVLLIAEIIIAPYRKH